MSDTGNTPATPPAEPAGPPPENGSPRRKGCLTALMVMAGIVMLLPGLCALIFTVSSLDDPHIASFVPLLVICFAVAFGGVMLLRAASRPPKR